MTMTSMDAYQYDADCTLRPYVSKSVNRDFSIRTLGGFIKVNI